MSHAGVSAGVKWLTMTLKEDKWNGFDDKVCPSIIGFQQVQVLDSEMGQELQGSKQIQC